MNGIGRTPLIRLEKISESGCADIYEDCLGAKQFLTVLITTEILLNL